MDAMKDKIKRSGLMKSHIAQRVGLSPAYFSMMINQKVDMPEEIRNKINIVLDSVIKLVK